MSRVLCILFFLFVVIFQTLPNNVDAPYPHTLSLNDIEAPLPQTLSLDDDPSDDLIPYSTGPLSFDSLLIGTLDGTVYGIDAETGVQLWSFRSGSDLFSSSHHPIIPGIDGGIYFYTVDGLKRLPANVQDIVNGSPFSVGDGVIYLGSKSTSLYILDYQTGEVHKCFGEQAPLEPAFDCDAPLSAIYLGRVDYSVRAVDMTTHQERWNITVGEYISTYNEENSLPSQPVSFLNKTLVSAITGELKMIDKLTGETLWYTGLSSPAIHYHPAVKGNDHMDLYIQEQMFISESDVFVGDFAGTLFAIPALPQFQIVSNLPEDAHLLPPSTDNWVLHFKQQQLINKDTGRVVVIPFVEECTPRSALYPYCLKGVHPNVIPRENSEEVCPTNVDVPVSTKPYEKWWILPSLLPFISVIIYLIRFKNSAQKIQTTKKEIQTTTKKENQVTNKKQKQQNETKKTPVIEEQETKKKKKKPTRSQEQNKPKTQELNKPKTQELNKPKTREQETSNNIPQKRKFRKKYNDKGNYSSDTDDNTISSDPTIIMDPNRVAVGRLVIYLDKILGYGSHGTVVYLGSFENRNVAIKRMLIDFYGNAQKEVDILIASDEHPSVVRYFAKEQDSQFVYLSLSYCPGSLFDLVEGPLYKTMTKADLVRLLWELCDGIRFLHRLNIVHRDLKPQNVLLSQENRVKISDMGLAKKLANEKSSFSASTMGTIGWQAPELLDGNVGSTTKKVDIFSLGCIIHYVLTTQHPFGDHYERQMCIMNGKPKFGELQKNDPLAYNLICKSVERNPKLRLGIEELYSHIFFWKNDKKLQFLLDVSDKLEFEKPTHPLVLKFESKAQHVIGLDWTARLHSELLKDINRFRKYDVSKMRDLLRIIRNKAHHYRDLPPLLQNELGSYPDGFFMYFQQIFPELLSYTYDFMKEECWNETMFVGYFGK